MDESLGRKAEAMTGPKAKMEKAWKERLEAKKMKAKTGPECPMNGISETYEACVWLWGMLEATINVLGQFSAISNG